MDRVRPNGSKETRTIILQIVLFVATFATTTLAGAELCFSRSILDEATPFTWNDFSRGMEFSIPLLLVLSVHEFGHYFTALYHRLKVSLPYYLPFPSMGMLGIGTFGAIIRIRSKVNSNLQHFDVGLAGPLAGFIAAIGVIWYGFATLPPPEYVFQFHPDYAVFGLKYAEKVYTEEYILSTPGKGALMFMLGDNLVFKFFSEFVADPTRMPNPYEIMHYPVLLAGYIALFFTSLNLLPIGQLDGGHIVYGLFGRKKHHVIATVGFIALVFYSSLGAANIHTDGEGVYTFIMLTVLFNFFCLRGLGLPVLDTFMYAMIMFAVQFLITAVYPDVDGYRLWCLFALLIGTFVGIKHPPTEIEKPLDAKRVILGWLSLGIFVVCFSPKPIVIEVIGFVEQQP